MLRIVLFGYHASTHQCCLFLLNKGVRVLHCYPKTRKITLIKNSYVAYYAFNAVNDPDLLAAIDKFNADYIMSIIFGEKIPADIVRACRYYGLNFHPAPLPQCRTANAWFWPIRLGYTQSAITVHLLAETYDTGDIVYERKFTIDPMDNLRTYEMKVIQEIRLAIEKLFKLIQTDQIFPTPQSGKGQYYSKLKLRDICIDWDEPAAAVYNLIRACNPYHPAVTHHKNNLLEIFEAGPTQLSPSSPGELFIDNDRLYCSCNEGVLEVTVFRFNGILSARRLIKLLSLKTGDMFTSSTQVESFERFLDRPL